MTHAPGSNGTGIEYPTIELGGIVYTLKFTRGGLLYRLGKNGVNLALLSGQRNFANLIDILHAALYGQFEGKPEELAELVVESGHADKIDLLIADALKKVSPPSKPAETAVDEPTPRT